MNREDRIYVVQWMLDFVQVDIDGLGPNEMWTLLMDLDAALLGVLGYPRLRHSYPYVLRIATGREPPEGLTAKGIANVRHLQQHMRFLLRDILHKIKKARESEEQWLEAKEFDNLFYLADATVKEAKLQAVIEADYDVPDERGGDEPMAFSWPEGSLSNGTIKIARLLPEDENGLVFYFLEALDGLPLRRLQECRECGRWFVILDEKKRTYCSHECRRKKENRDYHAKKREKDRAAYEKKLAEKRETEHTRYEDRKKKKGYKIDRRPHKKYRKED